MIDEVPINVFEQLHQENVQKVMETPWWKEHGYIAGKAIEGGLWLCVAPMIYTLRMMICDETSVMEFWCYPKNRLGAVLIAFEGWDGKGPPMEGWTKHGPHS